MNWDKLRLVTAPTYYPVTVEEAKTHLRIDHGEDDALIGSLLAAATAAIDGPRGAGLCLMSQTWELAFTAWPTSAISIPLNPVQSITSITYTDVDGADQTLSSSDYLVDVYSTPAYICTASGTNWPTAKAVPRSIRIRFVAGYATAAAIPADLKAAVLLMVGHLYANREAVNDTKLAILPMGVDAILNRHRVWI